MTVYTIAVPISFGEGSSQAAPDADPVVSRFCDALRVELRHTFPYTQVAVVRGSGPPQIVADSDDDTQHARRGIDLAYDRVIRRGAWRQTPEVSCLTSGVAMPQVTLGGGCA